MSDVRWLTDREERQVETPFGAPSAPYVIGTLRGKRVAFLARHGGRAEVRSAPGDGTEVRLHLPLKTEEKS